MKGYLSNTDDLKNISVIPTSIETEYFGKSNKAADEIKFEGKLRCMMHSNICTEVKVSYSSLFSPINLPAKHDILSDNAPEGQLPHVPSQRRVRVRVPLPQDTLQPE